MLPSEFTTVLAELVFAGASGFMAYAAVHGLNKGREAHFRRVSFDAGRGLAARRI
jgi:hypothetical protein